MTQQATQGKLEHVHWLLTRKIHYNTREPQTTGQGGLRLAEGIDAVLPTRAAPAQGGGAGGTTTGPPLAHRGSLAPPRPPLKVE